MILVTEVISTKKRNPNGTSVYDRDGDGLMHIIKVVHRDDEEPELKLTRKTDRQLKYRIAVKGGADDPKYYGFRPGLMIQIVGEFKKSKKTNLFYIQQLRVLTSHSQQQFLRDNNINPQELREQIIKDTDGKQAFLDQSEEARERVPQNVVALSAWLASHGYAVDLDIAYDINTFFTGRAQELKANSVVELLSARPFILAEINHLMDNLFSVNDLRKHFPIDTKNTDPKEIAFAKVCEVLQNGAQHGNSFMPADTVAYFARKELEAAGCEKDNMKKAVLKMVENHLSNEDHYAGYARINISHSTKNNANSMSEYFSSKRHTDLRTPKFFDMLSLVRCSMAEVGVAKLMGGLEYLKRENCTHIGLDPIDELLDDVDNYQNMPDFISKDELCLQALKNAFKYRMSAIVGCAGSGKSTLVGVLVNMLNARGKTSLLLAPSAMAAAVAASKVREVNNTDGFSEHMTIHKFARISELEEDKGSRFDITGIEPDAEEATKGMCVDFLIIDEMSMCTIPMFRKLLMALRDNSKVHVVLVGDSAQLPAIGPQFFYQIADEDSKFCEFIPTVRFNKNHRAEGKGSDHDLAKFVQSIRDGEPPKLPRNKKAVSLESVTMDDFFSKHKNIPEDTMFIAADAKTKARLNSILMEKFLGKEECRQAVGDTSFCIGEKVIATRNDYADKKKRSNRPTHRHEERKMDVYNGTFGRIKSYDAETDTAIVTLALPDSDQKEQNVKYLSCELPRYFEAAYALTVHKAQGSQAKNVVFFMKDNMSRSMLYTAATRAQEKLTLVGKKIQIDSATVNPIKAGYSRLFWRFVSLLKAEEEKAKKEEEVAQPKAA